MQKFDKFGANLIFIISLPRSGSTLLQRILGGHPQVLTLPEPWIMLHPLYALKNQGIVTEYESNRARVALNNYLNKCGGEDTYIKAIRSMASVLYSSALHGTDKNIFLDKTPRYYFIIPELYRVFPNAKFVFLLRNPLAILSSILETWFNNQPNLLMRSHNRIDIMRGPKLLLNGLNLLGDKAIILQYENLVSDPETNIRITCERLGLSYHDKLIDYGNTNFISGSFGDQVQINKQKRPIPDSANKWLKNLPANNLISFADKYLDIIGENVVIQLGYDFNNIKDELKKFKYKSDM